MTHRLPALIAVFCLAVVVASAFAQDGERRPYHEFKFDPNVEGLLKKKFQIEKDLGPFKDLVKQILADPAKMPVSPDKIKDMKLDDPKLKKAVEDWLASDPKLKDQVAEWIKKNPPDKQPDVKKLQEDLKKMVEKNDLRPDVPKFPPTRPVPPPKPPEMKAAEEAQRAMKDIERSRLGEWLRDSPAWQRAMQDLTSNIGKGTDGKRDWLDNLLARDGKGWKAGEDWWNRLRDMPRPDMENCKWDRHLPAIGEMPAPDIDGPSMPSFGRLPSVSNAVTWLLIVAVVVLVGWQLLRWTRRGSLPTDPRAALGPWPIQPGAVATRSDLVKAFDYLALLTLGPDVASWNHCAVAQRWCEKASAHAALVHDLASAYESARYTHGADELPANVRDQVRKSLALLAGAL